MPMYDVYAICLTPAALAASIARFSRVVEGSVFEPPTLISSMRVPPA